jgi:hypothetical protein
MPTLNVAIVWPLDLPRFDETLVADYEETLTKTSVNSEVDVGPPKVRQRTTVPIGEMKVGYWMSRDQVNILERFIDSTLQQNSRAFEATHPRSGKAIKARLKEMPRYEPKTANYFKVTFKIEILPT